MAQQIPVTVQRSNLQQVAEVNQLMDLIQWDIDDNALNGSISDPLHQKIKDGLSGAFEALRAIEQTIRSTDRPEYLGSTDQEGFSVQIGFQHAQKKYARLQQKVISLTPAGPTLAHPQFQRHAQIPSLTPTSPPSTLPIAASLTPRRVVSFNIAPVTAITAAQPSFSPSTLLTRISFFLRNGNEAQALQEFNQLPAEMQKDVYEAMWIVRGRPMPGNPIAHDNFGEVSFKNQERRCSSTPQQKACAVELTRAQASLMEMIQLLGQKNLDGAKKVFEALPTELQNEIYGKHWEVCGKPTDQSSDQRLKQIAHPDFGKVSFLGLDPRCDVPAEKKIETLRVCLSVVKQKREFAQKSTEQASAQWKLIDSNREMKGPQKNAAKKDSMLALARAIVPLFMNGVTVQPPTPAINTATSRPADSFQAMASAYVENYPCLKPYFLQLANDLTFASETLATPQQMAQEPRKSSQLADPNLGEMSDRGRKQYRTGIMGETLDTLQKGYYINSKGEKVTLNLNPAIQSLYCQSTSGQGTVRQAKYKTKLFLDKKDCLTVTRDLAERGLNPIVLDAASNGHFGGGYKTGAGAQEENMCRRSGLCVAADPTLGNQLQDFYPLSKNGWYAGLYVSQVPVFRGEEEEGYPYLDKPFETAVAIVAAPNFNAEHQRRNGMENPIVIINGRIPQPYDTEMKQKLHTVLHMAEKNGHDSIVLMPLGCGAFCNPPGHVSEMIMELITEEFPHSFKEVHISIIDDHNAGKAHNPRGNFAEFKDTIEQQFLGKLQGIGATYQIT